MIHPTAIVESEFIGENTTIWQFCVVLKDSIIGSNCNINAHVFIENNSKIGNNVTIKSGVQIWSGVEIRDNAFIGPNVTFTNDLIPRSKKYPSEFLKTIINKGASIGANATLLAGIEIGEYSLIGAGSVVTKNVPAFGLVVGNPARHIGYISPNGEILDLSFYSKSTKNKYRIENNNLIISND